MWPSTLLVAKIVKFFEIYGMFAPARLNSGKTYASEMKGMSFNSDQISCYQQLPTVVGLSFNSDQISCYQQLPTVVGLKVRALGQAVEMGMNRVLMTPERVFCKYNKGLIFMVCLLRRGEDIL